MFVIGNCEFRSLSRRMVTERREIAGAGSDVLALAFFGDAHASSQGSGITPMEFVRQRNVGNLQRNRNRGQNLIRPDRF